jgi:tetratricopeptide (TPR) repeat protein
VAAEVRRQGGVVEDLVGDTVAAVVPAPGTPDPARAVRAALAVQRGIESLNAGHPERLPVAIRIGIACGDIEAGTPSAVPGTVLGEAARVQDAAPPGSVLVTDEVYRATREGFVYRSLADGDEPAGGELFQALGERAGADPEAHPLLGRDTELALLHLLLARTVEERRPGLVTLVAPPGVGKARLARAFGAAVGAERTDARVLAGRCRELNGPVAFAPLAEILATDVGLTQEREPHAARDLLRSELESREVPKTEVTTDVLLASLGIQVSPNPLTGSPPEVARAMTVTAWRRYAAAMAARGPVVWIVEDVQWIHDGTREVIEALMSSATGPLLLVCTASTGPSLRLPRWDGHMPNSTTVGLSPLGPSSAEALVRSLLEGGDVADDIVQAVVGWTRGNPLFTEHVVRMLAEEHLLLRERDGWALNLPVPTWSPRSVHDVVTARIEALPPGERRAIQDAAVMGTVFWDDALAALGSLDVEAALEALVSRDMIFERDPPTFPGRREFAFRHVAIRDAAYRSTPLARRTEGHARAARWLEETAPARTSDLAETLTHHFVQASDLKRAAPYAAAVADRRRRLGAVQDALRWYDLTVEGAEEAADHRLRAEALMGRAAAWARFASPPDAMSDLTDAVAAAHKARVPALQARALLRLARAHDRLGEADKNAGDLDAAVDTARRAKDVRARVEILSAAAAELVGAGEWGRALELAEESAAAAEPSGDPEAQAAAGAGMAVTRLFAGQVSEALAEATEAAHLLSELGRPAPEHRNAVATALSLWVAGRYDESRAVADQVETVARAIDDRGGRAAALVVRALTRFSRGDVGAALADLEEAVRAGEIHRSASLQLAARLVRLGVLGELRATDRAAEELEAVERLADSPGTGFLRPLVDAFRGWAALRAGDGDAAARHFVQASELASGSRLVAMWCAHVEVCAREEAADPGALAEAARRLGALAVDRSPALSAWAEYARGLSAALSADPEKGESRASAALALADGVGDWAVAWRALALLAALHEARDRRGEAEAERARAARTVRDLTGRIPDQDLVASFRSRPDVQALFRSNAGLIPAP